MKEDYLITIQGSIELDDTGDADTDHVKLTTKGNFVQKNGNYFITYTETQTTGFDGNTTTVKVEGQNRVSMIRYGNAPSQLVIEKGRRHVCHYDTGVGALTLGVSADEINSKLTNAGGSLKFSYMLDVDAQCISKNFVNITVKRVVC